MIAFTSAIVILIFCIAGALIAWLADNVGRMIGKKRHTLWKLRPRHTATLFIVTAGFLIPLLTVIALASSSRDLREILKKGTELVQENNQRKQELAATVTKLNSSNNKIKDKNTEIKGLTEKQVKLNTDLGYADERLKTSQGKVQTMTQRAGLLNGQISNLRNVLGSTRGKISAIQNQLVQKRQDLDQKSKNFQTLQNDLRDAYTKYDELTKEIDSKEKGIKELQEQIKKAQIDFGNVNGELENANKLSKEQREQIASLSNEISTKQHDLENINTQVQQLQAAAVQLSQNSAISRTQNVVFHINDEVARMEVPGALSYGEAGRLIERAIGQARQNAKEAGAGKFLQYDFADFRDRADESGTKITAESQKSELKESLVRQSEPQLLILSSVWNTFNGESVPLRYQLVPNRVVFLPGDIISETKVDGTDRQEDIADALTKWLVTQLPIACRKAGIYPSIGQPQAFGAISQKQVISLASDVKRNDRKLRVQMIAKSTIRASGPLSFEFRLR